MDVCMNWFHKVKSYLMAKWESKFFPTFALGGSCFPHFPPCRLSVNWVTCFVSPESDWATVRHCSPMAEVTLLVLMCLFRCVGPHTGHTQHSYTHTYTHTHTHICHTPGPLILSNHPNLNPLNVIIIIIIIITLGNSGNSTSSFNSQLGVQEQRRHALYDSGPGNPSPREGARRTGEADEGKRWRRHGTDSKKKLPSYCPRGESLIHWSHWYDLRFHSSRGQLPTMSSLCANNMAIGTNPMWNPSARVISGARQPSEIQKEGAVNFPNRQCFINNQVMWQSAHKEGKGLCDLGAASVSELELFCWSEAKPLSVFGVRLTNAGLIEFGGLYGRLLLALPGIIIEHSCFVL